MWRVVPSHSRVRCSERLDCLGADTKTSRSNELVHMPEYHKILSIVSSGKPPIQ